MATITDDQKAEIRALFDQGLSRNEIARRTGVSAGSVTKIINDSGRSFDRSATKDATRAKQLDLAAARLSLAERLNDAAHAMLDMIDQPFTVYAFGGRDNTFAQATLDSAPVDARRTIITSAAIVFDKITKIIDSTPTESVAEAESVLDRLEAEFDAEFSGVDDAEFGMTS
jgi:transcriptional regulator with XRE-family HTH domain